MGVFGTPSGLGSLVWKLLLETFRLLLTPSGVKVFVIRMFVFILARGSLIYTRPHLLEVDVIQGPQWSSKASDSIETFICK
jgi:hypothetical protein